MPPVKNHNKFSVEFQTTNFESCYQGIRVIDSENVNLRTSNNERSSKDAYRKSERKVKCEHLFVNVLV